MVSKVVYSDNTEMTVREADSRTGTEVIPQYNIFGLALLYDYINIKDIYFDGKTFNNPAINKLKLIRPMKPEFNGVNFSLEAFHFINIKHTLDVVAILRMPNLKKGVLEARQINELHIEDCPNLKDLKLKNVEFIGISIIPSNIYYSLDQETKDVIDSVSSKIEINY